MNNTCDIIIKNVNAVIPFNGIINTNILIENGKIMHFDVIVESSTPHEKAIEYGKEYLKDAGQDGQSMTQEECQFCHVQEAPKIVEDSIQKSGYFIQKMEGCP